MRQDYTDITVILDRSGSMDVIKSDMEGGFNQFIRDQKKLPGELLVSLFQWDSYSMEWVYQGKRVEDVPPLQLIPRGNTPLWDAVGRAVVETGERLAGLNEKNRPGHVVCIIITDGLENASREWTANRVKALVKEQQEKWKWQFQFFGANIDAYQVGAQMGVAQAQSANYVPTAASVGASFEVMSNKVSTLRSQQAGENLQGFTDEERERIGGTSSRKTKKR